MATVSKKMSYNTYNGPCLSKSHVPMQLLKSNCVQPYTPVSQYFHLLLLAEGPATNDPGRTSARPGGEDDVSESSDSSPGVSDANPGVSESSPGSSDSTPGGSDSTPGDSDSSPGGGDASPGGDPGSPGGDDSTQEVGFVTDAPEQAGGGGGKVKYVK